MHFYTIEEIEYLREITPGRTNKEITKMFNKKFDLNQSEKAIAGTRKRYGIKTGRDGRFKKGYTPWNKGKKGITTGGKETQFKKGHKPHSYLPVGTEKTKTDGYMYIKIKDPNVWKQKHILIWEKHNGKVPKGHCIIFGDGNNRNFDIDNLICVSRSQLARLNQYGLIKNHADLTRTGIAIANLKTKIWERSKKK